MYDSEDSGTIRRFSRLILLVVVAVPITLVQSCRELGWMMQSETATAKVNSVKYVEAYEGSGLRKRGASGPRYLVDYTFSEEDGTKRREKDYLPYPSNLVTQDTETIEVQYFAGFPDESRVMGTANYTPFYMLGGAVGISALAVGGFLIYFYKFEASRS